MQKKRRIPEKKQKNIVKIPLNLFKNRNDEWYYNVQMSLM